VLSSDLIADEAPARGPLAGQVDRLDHGHLLAAEALGQAQPAVAGRAAR